MLSLDTPKASYGCGFNDIPCYALEGVANFTASWIRAMGDFMADMLLNAFKDSTIDKESWDVADGQFLFWVAVMSGVILAIGVVQIGIAAIIQDWKRLGRVAGGMALAVPFSALGVIAMQRGVTVTDAVTNALIATVQGGSMGDALLRIVGLAPMAQASGGAPADPALPARADWIENGTIYKLIAGGATASPQIGMLTTAAVLVAVMAIASFFLFVSMSIRSYTLLALAAMAPIGLMMIGQPKLIVWAERWASLTTGMLLAKPMAAGVLLLSVQLTAGTNNLGILIVSAVAIIAAAAAPIWAVQLVAFAGQEVGNALQRRPSVTQTINKVRVLTPRLGR